MKRSGRTIGLGVLVLVVLCFAFTLSKPAYTKETIKFAFPGSTDNLAVFKYGELLYTEAFKRLGYEFSYEVFPPKRASYMASMGQFDGEPARVAGYGSTFPNLIMVDESVLNLKFLAITSDPNIKISGWEDLRNTDYTIEYYHGNVIIEKMLSKFAPPKRVTAIYDHALTYKKLLAGRVQIFIDLADRVTPTLASSEYKDTGLRVAGVVHETFGYPYLNKRHADLAPKLAAVLKQMKSEGLLQKFMKQAHNIVKQLPEKLKTEQSAGDKSNVGEPLIEKNN